MALPGGLIKCLLYRRCRATPGQERSLGRVNSLSILESSRVPWTEAYSYSPWGPQMVGHVAGDSKAQQHPALRVTCKSYWFLLCLVQRVENCLFQPRERPGPLEGLKEVKGIPKKFKFVYLLCEYLGGDALEVGEVQSPWACSRAFRPLHLLPLTSPLCWLHSNTSHRDRVLSLLLIGTNY